MEIAVGEAKFLFLMCERKDLMYFFKRVRIHVPDFREYGNHCWISME